jgi:ectoine hydroxylase-related dioxygenase (phytanoyl-CoA dioxygenase family)
MDQTGSIAAQYRRDGFFAPVPVLSSAEAASYRKALEDLESAIGTRSRFPNAHRYLPWAFDLATHPAVLDVIEEILGPEVIAWGSLILKKPPDRESLVPWHQDGAYRPGIRPGSSLSAWIALSESRAVHGCLRVIPGSHHTVLRHAEVGRRATLLNRGQEIVEEVREEDAVDVELRPGEMSLHDLNTIHSSAPNRSTSDRIGFIVRYAMPQAEPPAGPVIVVRGTGTTSRADMHARLAATTSPEDVYRDYCRGDVVVQR